MVAVRPANCNFGCIMAGIKDLPAVCFCKTGIHSFFLPALLLPLQATGPQDSEGLRHMRQGREARMEAAQKALEGRRSKEPSLAGSFTERRVGSGRCGRSGFPVLGVRAAVRAAP